MDIPEFLLASGLGLLIVLVGWSSQIASKSKETKDLENEFLKKADIKDAAYKKMKKGGATKDSLFAIVDFLYSKKTDDKDIEIFEKIKAIKADIVTLDKKYSCRFWVLLSMNISLFISGTVALFLPENMKVWVLPVNFVFVVILFCNLINVYLLEKRYSSNILIAMENL